MLAAFFFPQFPVADRQKSASRISRVVFMSRLQYPEIRDRLIMLDGWSKTYAMTGWRMGYAVWPRWGGGTCRAAVHQ